MSSRNHHAQVLHEQTITNTRFSHWKLLSKNTHLLCEHYVIRWREDI